jgi:hypothetical protein
MTNASRNATTLVLTFLPLIIFSSSGSSQDSAPSNKGPDERQKEPYRQLFYRKKFKKGIVIPYNFVRIKLYNQKRFMSISIQYFYSNIHNSPPSGILYRGFAGGLFSGCSLDGGPSGFYIKKRQAVAWRF